MANNDTSPSRDTAPVAPPLRWRRIGAVFGLILASTSPAQPVSPGEFADERLELPPFTVLGKFELPKPESWHYARIEGFEVLATGSGRETVRLVRDFERFRQAIRIIYPSAVPPVATSSLIICGGGGKFRDFTASGQRDYNGTVSLFLHDREQTAIVVDFETKVLNLNGGAMLKPSGEAFEEILVEHERQLIRQYVRFLLIRTDFPPPPWVVEGLTQIIMDIEVGERGIKLGRLDVTRGAPLSPLLDPDRPFDVNSTATGDMTGRTTDAGSMLTDLAGSASQNANSLDPTTSVGDRPFNVVLAHAKLLPWGKFFAVTADAPEAVNPLGDCLWAKQAYAFVHFCLFRADGKYRQPYATFVRRLANEPLSEALFQECFQISYLELNREMLAYIDHPRHVFRHIGLTEKGRLVADIKFREATQSEVGRIKGSAQRLAGRPADALLTLQTAYARGERDPALLAAVGVAEYQAGQTARARKFLEAAAKLGADRPSAWVALARLRFDEAKARPAAAGNQLSPAQVSAVFEPLAKARTLSPALPDTFEMMAEVWMASAVPPTIAQVHAVGEGIMHFPFNSELTYRTARLYLRAGDPRNAAEVARMGLRFATDTAERLKLEEFLSAIPTAAATPPDAS